MPHTSRDTSRAPAQDTERPIVIIEDDPATLSGWTELLRNAGYDVVGAASFEQGREALQAGPALLIVDIRLGAFNGLQLIIRARSDRPEIPLIVVTGFADEAVRSAADLWGATYLEKPVQPAQLLEAVARALASPPMRTEGAAESEPRMEPERRRWSRPHSGNVVSMPPGIADKDPAWHPSLIEDGDVIVARESADVTRTSSARTTSITPQFRLTVRGLPYLPPRLFARYDHAILHGEKTAAERHVRLFYVDTGILILLQDHRPTRIVH